jgi:hypothetical protein
LRALVLVLLLGPALAPTAHAADAVLPTCKALVPRLERDPSSQRNGSTLLGVDEIVEDVASTEDARACTGVAQYRDATSHITWTATWDDPKHTAFDVNGHETTEAESYSRARSLRIRNHPPGLDGAILIRSVVPFCADAAFTKLAENELHLGISFRDAFYREPDYKILSMSANGYGSGVVINCLATVGNSTTKGTIFIGTNWSETDDRKYELYILSPGPDGFTLTNRLWTMGTE